MNRVVFNGQTGGLGRYLAAALAKQRLSTSALLSRLGDDDGLANELNSIPIADEDIVTLIPLAGLVPVVVCEKEPERAFKTNVIDLTALVSRFLAWAHEKKTRARVLYVSSGHVYAPKEGRKRLIEIDPVKPRSVYARTKWEAEEALRALFKDHTENLLIARVFGLLSPEQPLPYVLPSMIRRAQEKDFLNMGGLDCVRDYLDARDVCRLLATLCGRDWSEIARPINNVLNISSGEGTAIRDLFSMALEAVGLRLPDVENQMTLSPPRADDIAWMVGDPTALAKQVRVPMRSIPLRQTVQQAAEAAQSSPSSAIDQ